MDHDNKYKEKYIKLKKIYKGGSIIDTSILEQFKTFIASRDHIVVLTGGTGSVGSAILNKLLSNTNIGIINITRTTSRDASSKILEFTKSPDNKFYNLTMNKEGYNSSNNINLILDALKELCHKCSDKKWYIVNCAADKDTRVVKETIKTYNITNILHHWTLNFIKKLAIFANERNIPLIHFSTVYVSKGNSPTSRGWDTTLKQLDHEKVDKSSDYIYGYVKALAEKILLENHPMSFIIRLPGIIEPQPTLTTTREDTNFLNSVITTYTTISNSKIQEIKKHLMKSSPGYVLHTVLENISSDRPIALDDQQLKYPVTTKNIADFTHDIIEELSKCPHSIVGDIVNFGGSSFMTKYQLASYFIQQLKSKTSGIDIKLKLTPMYVVNEALPYSELMIMNDSNLPRCLQNINYSKYTYINPFYEIVDLFILRILSGWNNQSVII
jgi:dTDP-4-dehydrorhamnose reductase